ncbi:MAG: CD1871A family CXXC motif-containing protein [Bacillota bacterium]
MRKHQLLRQNRWALFGLAAGSILCVAGILRGDVAMVLNKAARICLECIGVG